MFIASKFAHCGVWSMSAREVMDRFWRQAAAVRSARHRGGPFGGRGPRMFDPGALRLVVLGLIAEEPRRGYDIIKALEAKFQGAYSPSPGAIYRCCRCWRRPTSCVAGERQQAALFDHRAGEGLSRRARGELAEINAQIDEASTRPAKSRLATRCAR